MQKHIKELDYLRAIAICAVLILHSVIPAASLSTHAFSTFFGIVLSRIFSFGVPMFFFISGFCLWYRYKEEINVWNFYKKRFLKILPIYIIFSFIYELVAEQPFSPNKYFYDLRYGTSRTHMYFLLLIMVYYLLFPFIRKIYLRYKTNASFLFVAPLILISLPVLFYLVIGKTNLPDIFGPWHDQQEIFFELRIIRYFVYFVVGIYACDNWPKLSQLNSGKLSLYIAPSFFSLLLFQVAIECLLRLPNQSFYYIQLFNDYLILSLYCVSASLFFLRYVYLLHNGKYKNVLLQLGQASFAIYLIHPVIISEIYFKVIKNSVVSHSWVMYIIIFLPSLLIAYTLAKIWQIFERSKFNSLLLKNLISLKLKP